MTAPKACGALFVRATCLVPVGAAVLLAVCLFAGPLAAQDLATRLGERWRWRELPSPSETGRHHLITLDAEGRLVSASPAGLYRYEDRWVPVPGGEALADKEVIRMERSGDGLLFVVRSGDGLLLRLGRSVVFLTPSGDLEEPALDPGALAIGSLEDGRAWVLAREWLAILAGSRVVRRLDLPAEAELVHSLGLDADGRVWLTAKGGMLRETADGWEEMAPPPGVSPSFQYLQILYAEGDLFVFPHRFSGAHPVLRWDGSELSATSEEAYCWGATFVPGEGFVLSNRSGGLTVLADDVFTHVPRLEDVDGQLEDLLWTEDDRLLARGTGGRLWVCDLGSERWEVHPPPGAGERSTVNSLARSRRGGFWVGTAGGILRWDGQGFVDACSEVEGVPLRPVTTVHEDESGVLWAGSGSGFTGVVRQEGDERRFVSEPFDDHCVHAIRPGREGETWFLLLGRSFGISKHDGGGAVRFDGERWRRYTRADGLPHGRCYDVAVAPDGTTYLGTFGGIAVLEGDRWRPLASSRGLQVRVLHLDPDGVLWAGQGVNVAGVTRFRDGVQLPGTAELDRLLTGSIRDAPQGGVWIASPMGAFRSDDRGLHPASHGMGVPAVDFWPLLVEEDGTLWLGSLGRGLLRYRPEDRSPPERPVLDLTLDEETDTMLARWRSSDPWELTSRRDLRYSVRLDGGTWSTPGREKESRLEELASGPHEFEVVAFDLAGNASPPARTTFVVRPPLSERPEVVLPIGAGLAALVVLLGIVIRQRTLGRRAEVRERTRLEASERHFRSLVEGVRVLFASLDAKGRPLYISPPLLALAGTVDAPRDLEELLATADERDRERVEGFVSRTRERNPLPATGELRLRAADGSTRWIYAILSPRRDLGGALEGFDLVAVDLTERKEAELERTQLETWRRQVQKMESLGQLAAGVAHDFNNILTAIAGNAELCRRTVEHLLGGEHPSLGHLDQIEASSSRAASLTRQLLAFSRQQVLRPEVVRLGDVLERMRDLLRRLLRENIGFALHIEDAPPVRVDVGQIEQALLNLIVNAQDAMPDGGTLTIRSGRLRVERGARVPPGEYALLHIEDTGHGMDEETRKRVFEPFFTTKGLGEGTGLGLSMVHGIVEQSGGHVRVDSRPSFGTTFEILLPAVGEETERLDVTKDGPVRGGRETLLVCEDDDSVRRFAARTLQSRGYLVHSAESPLEALELARQHPDIAMLVTDVVMPDMSGPELAAELVDERPDLKVLYVSGYTSDLLADARVEGDFLQKPFRMEELLRAVREALDTRAQVPDPVVTP